METLIKLVKERPIFYDHENIDFSNRDKKMETWNEIANIIGSENGNYWRIKWNCLKDNFYKYKKYAENSSKNTYKKYRNWPWAEHMKFLNEFTKPNRKKQKKAITKQEENNETTVEEITTNLPDEFGEIPQTKIPKLKKRKRKFKDEFVDKLTQYFDMNDNQNQNFDEVDHIFMSYAQKFKRLPVGLQHVFKLEMITLFARYEMMAEIVCNNLPCSDGI